MGELCCVVLCREWVSSIVLCREWVSSIVLCCVALGVTWSEYFMCMYFSTPEIRTHTRTPPVCIRYPNSVWIREVPLLSRRLPVLSLSF